MLPTTTTRWTLPVVCLILGCGTDPTLNHATVVHDAGVSRPQDAGVPPTLTLTPADLTLALGETRVIQATVTGADHALVSWSWECEDGRISLSVEQNTLVATVHAERAGTCALEPSLEHQVWAGAWVWITPLPRGNDCSSDAQCAPEAPFCRATERFCGPTCTSACKTDADCPGSFCLQSGVCQVYGKAPALGCD